MSIQTGQPVLTLTVAPTKPNISLIWYDKHNIHKNQL